MSRYAWVSRMSGLTVEFPTVVLHCFPPPPGKYSAHLGNGLRPKFSTITDHLWTALEADYFYHLFRTSFMDNRLPTCTLRPSFLPHPTLLIKGVRLASPDPRHEGSRWATVSLELTLGSHRKTNGHPSVDYCPDSVDQLSSWS